MNLILKMKSGYKRRISRSISGVIVVLIFVSIVFQISACQSSIQDKPIEPRTENTQTISYRKDLEEKQTNTLKNVDHDLEQNRRLWNEKKFVNYNITISVSQGGNISYPNPALIKVRDGKVISISSEAKIDEKSMERLKEIETVEKLFDVIRQGYEKEAKVTVKYNKNDGYPEKITVDDFKKGVDNWITIEVNKFEVIK